MEFEIKDVLYIVGIVVSALISFLGTRHKLKEYIRDKNDALKDKIHNLELLLKEQKSKDDLQQQVIDSAILIFPSVFLFGMVIEAIGLAFHNRDLNRSNNEGGAAHYVQCTTFGKTYLFRNYLLAINISIAAVALTLQASNIINDSLTALWLVLALINVFTAAIGRALFYILVIPTTMPGAFFWKNKGFEQHARDIGLADNPACGVAPLVH